jgi:hypothetical protein
MIPLSVATICGDNFRSIAFFTTDVARALPEVLGLGVITVAPGLTGLFQSVGEW